MRVNGAWVVPLALVVAVVAQACGAAAPDEHESDTYVYESKGTRFTYTVLAPPDNEMVQRVEEHRRKTGAAPVSYILVTMDNTNGHEERFFPNLGVVTEDKEPIVFLEARRVFAAWSRGGDSAVRAEGAALFDEFYQKESAPPGGTMDALLASLVPVSSVWRVLILSSLFDAMEGGQPPAIELQKQER